MVSRTLLEFQFDYDSYKEEGSTLFSFILFQSIFECVRKQSWMNMLSLLNVSHSILAIKSFMFSHSVMSDSLQPHGQKHARHPCPSPTPETYSCLSSWWCHPIISSSVVPFSSHLQSFPTSGSFLMSQFFLWKFYEVDIIVYNFNWRNAESRVFSFGSSCPWANKNGSLLFEDRELFRSWQLEQSRTKSLPGNFK